MLNAMQGPCNPVLISLASTDYTVATSLPGKKIVAISTVGGNTVVCDFIDDEGTSKTNIPLPSNQMIGVQNLSVVKKAGTDVTSVVLWWTVTP